MRRKWLVPLLLLALLTLCFLWGVTGYPVSYTHLTLPTTPYV